MPKPRPTHLTAYEFTPEEYYAATRFTELNLMLFQTLAADALASKVNLKIDLKEDTLMEANAKYMQQEAELTGMKEAFEQLLYLAETVTLANAKEQTS